MTKPILDLSERNFKATIKKGNWVVDFWAPWCGPCKMLGPIFKDAAKKIKIDVNFAKVNVDDNPELAQEHGIMSIPTILFLSDGKRIVSKTGVPSVEDLVDWIEETKDSISE